MLPFTDREMQRAWRENMSASDKIPRSNAHRLLLFYAVECGLKAVLMKRQGLGRTDACPDIYEAKHNLNKLLDFLHAGVNLKLPSQIVMNDSRNRESRVSDPGQINQMWRYGGKSVQPTDDELEKKLSAISEWIRRELGGIA